MRGAYRAGVHLGGDRVVLGAVDRAEAHVVARAEQDRIGARSDRRGGPACGRAPRSRRGSPPSRCSTARRRCSRCRAGVFGRGFVEARDRQALGHAGHVGQAGREADEVDVVVGLRVQPRQLVGRRARAWRPRPRARSRARRRSSTAAPRCGRAAGPPGAPRPGARAAWRSARRSPPPAGRSRRAARGSWERSRRRRGTRFCWSRYSSARTRALTSRLISSPSSTESARSPHGQESRLGPDRHRPEVIRLPPACGSAGR